MKDLFYKPLKIKGLDDEILFWGCTHWGHNPQWENPIWKRRGFTSVEEHDYKLIDRWNELATDNTIAFILGDLIFGHQADERLISIFNRLKFKELYVMSGNHTAGFKQIFESCEHNIKYLDNGKAVIFTPNYLEAFINGLPVVMCHYPILSWNGQGKNSVHLFSHVHNSLGNSELGRMYLEKSNCLETSVEVRPYPLTFRDIRNLTKDKAVFTPDHHGPEIKNPF